MEKLLLTLIGIATLTHIAKADDIALSWDFGVGTPNNAPSVGTPSNFAVSAFTLGNSLGNVTTPINTSSASTGYPGASGSENLGNAVKIGAIDVTTSAYYEFTLTADPGYTVSLTNFDFGSRSTATGPKSFALYSSADSYTASLFTGTLLSNSTWAFFDNSISSPVVSDGGGALTYRLFLYDGTGSPASGTENNRIDDVSMTVTTAPIPEPGTVALVGLGLGAILFGVRRRRA